MKSELQNAEACPAYNQNRSPGEKDKKLGFRIRKLRQDKKLSLEVVAAAITVSKQQLRKYELGHNKISATRLVQIANALGVHVSDLIGGKVTEVTALDREAERLWKSISDPQHKNTLLDMMRIAARHTHQNEPEVYKQDLQDTSEV